MTPTCTVTVAGTLLADRAVDLAVDLEPTVLADVSVSWGRSNTFDQPPAATCTFVVLDRSGGTSFVDRLHVGDPVHVHTSGDTGVGTPVDVAVDGGFEASPVGPAGNRVAAVSPAVATIVDTPTATGTRSVRVTAPTTAHTVTRFPPASFTPGDPAGWDAIPRLGSNAWQWSIAVRPALHAKASVIGVGFDNPQAPPPVGTVGARTSTVWGDASTWLTLAGEAVASTATANLWLGLSVTFDAATWVAPYGQLASPYSWAEAPGTWAAYGPSYVDNVELMAPAGGTVRTVLVFAGRITDMAATIDDPDGTVRVDVTAVDQLADLENRYVIDTPPWPVESFASRVNRIVAAVGLDVDVIIDEPLRAQLVTWVDVDNQSAGGLLDTLAAGVDAVRWSATHSTTGEYLWFEDVAERAQTAVLEVVDGFVTIVVSTERPAGRTVLDGCEILTDELTWIRDVSDVITHVDATWQEQTVDGGGLPKPTTRNVRVSDPALEAAYGVRRLGLTTPLTTSAGAVAVAERVMFRTRNPAGRIDGLTWDLGRFPPDVDHMGAALDLLDGTVRIGRAVIVENAELWPEPGTIAVYVDGGRYLYNGAWVLGLDGTPLAGMGESAEWDDLDPAWSWDEFDPAIEWPDLYGVAGPLAT